MLTFNPYFCATINDSHELVRGELRCASTHDDLVVVLRQVAVELAAVAFLIGQQFDTKILRGVVLALTQADDLVVLINGVGLRFDHAADHCHHVG